MECWWLVAELMMVGGWLVVDGGFGGWLMVALNVLYHFHASDLIELVLGWNYK